MSSEQSPENDVSTALAAIGEDAGARAAILGQLRDWEKSHRSLGVDLRETVLAPLVDALHTRVPEIARRLSNGLVMSLPYRSKIAREFALAEDAPDHVWEPQTTKLLIRLAETAQAALIGGAYAGDHAILMAHRMRARGGTCHCFEVNARQMAALRANAEANALTNLVFNEIGLWDRATRIVLSGSDSHACPSEASGDGPDTLPTTTIDDYALTQDIPALDIIMLDIEGGELPALRGARAFLSQPPEQAPDLVFEVHRAYVDWSDGLAKTEICRHVAELGYEIYAIRDYQANVAMSGAPIEVVPMDSVYLEGPPHGFNLFATKRPETLARLDIRLCPGVSPKLLHHRDPALHQPLHT